jgi:hypothetical protein
LLEISSFVFDQESISKYIIQHWFQKFRVEKRSVKDKETHRSHSAIDNNNVKIMIEAEPIKNKE